MAGKTRFAAIRWARDIPTMLHRGRIDRLGHHLALLMSTYAKNDGTDVWVSVETLTKQCHAEPAEFEAALGRLEALGYIKRAAASNGAAGWALDLSIEHGEDSVMESRAERRRTADRERKRRERERQQSESHAQVDRDVTQELGVTTTHVTQEFGVSHAEVQRDNGDVTQEFGVSHASESVTPAGQSPVTPLNSLKEVTPKEELHSGTTYRAQADASLAEDDAILDAEIVEEDEPATAGGVLFAVADSPAEKPKGKSAKKPKVPKVVDPAVKARQEQAQQLAKAYYDAMGGMVKFVGVQQIILTALGRFPYEQVRDGVKHLAQVDRHRPLTRQTLLNAIEGTGRPNNGQPAGLPRLSTGDRRVVEGEWLKSAPNWEALAQVGITPENAHHFGYRRPA